MKVVSAPKKLVIGTAKERGCKRALRIKVQGPKLDSNESMSLWTTATVVGGGAPVDTEFTYDVYPGKTRKIFPSDQRNICQFLSALLTVKGTYKIRIKVEAVIRSGINVGVAEAAIPVTVKYTGYYG